MLEEGLQQMKLNELVMEKLEMKNPWQSVKHVKLNSELLQAIGERTFDTLSAL